MNTKLTPNRILAGLTAGVSTLQIVALLVLCGAPNPAHAASDTWTGGGASDNWTDANNWGGVAPSPADQLFFDGSTRLTPNNDFPAGTIFNNINFNSGAGIFTLGGAALVLTNGSDIGAGLASGGGITNSSPNAETVNLPLTLSAGKHNIETDLGAGQLNLSGAFTRNTGGTVVFAPNGNAVNFTGSGLANANGILGGWATLANDWAALDGSGNVVVYTAYTDLGFGGILNNPASNVRYIGDSANITNSASGIAINSLLTQQGVARTLTITGTMKLGSRGGLYRNGAATGGFTVTGGLLTANGGGEITLSDAPFAATANNLTVNSVITNDGPANAVSVNVMGYVAIGSANTYSGGTFINQGRVQAGNIQAFGTNVVTIYPGGEAFLNAGGIFPNRFDITGVGTTEANGGINGAPGAIRLNSTANITNKVTFHGNARISTSSTSPPLISGPITGDGQLEFITFATANSTLLLTNNTGTPNDWPGGTVISALVGARGVFIKLGANEQIPDGPGRGNLTINATDVARLDLNGHNETINGLVSGTATTNANVQVANFGSAPSVLTIGNNNATATFLGNIQDGTAPNVLSIVKIGTGTQTFTGVDTYKGSTIVNGGSLVFGAGAWSTATPQITVNSNATLDVSAITPSTFAVGQSLTCSNGTIILPASPNAPTLAATNFFSLGATNFLKITEIGGISAYPAQFAVLKGTNVFGTLNFGLSGSLPPTPGTPFVGFLSNNVANNSVDLYLTSGPLQIRWSGFSGGVNNSAWDTTTPNWKLFSGTPTTYADGGFVFLDDSASNSIVTLQQTVTPAGITITNNVLNYTINDTLAGFFITGAGSLVKQGSARLTLDNSGVNDFSGGVTISGGTLQIGNSDANGNLPASGSVSDNGALVFARTDAVTIGNLISGTGSLTQNGAGGTLTLGGANTFTGVVTVAQGTLQTANNSALGTTNGGTTIASGATLDVDNSSLGAEPVTVSGIGVGGNGAIINSTAATAALAALNRVTMTADTTFGGSGRWDIRSTTSGLTDPALCSLSTGGNAYNLTKIGANFIAIANVTIDPKLANINITSGTLSFESNTTGLGDPTKTLTVSLGATLELWNATNLFNKQFVLNGDGAANTLFNGSGANTVIGPMVLNGSVIAAVNGTSLTLNGPLSGSGTLTKIGLLPLTYNGNGSTLLGAVTVSAGAFNLNGILGGPLTNTVLATVTGTGTNLGVFDASGTIFPGGSNSVGTLTVGTNILELGATLGFDLAFANTPGGGTNDLIVVNGDLTVNGNTININPLSILQPGVPYRLFNYTGNLIWNSDLNIPGVLGYTFTFNTNTPGQVNMVASGGPPVWNGGSASDSNWSDAANWGGVTIAASGPLVFDGINRVNNTNDTTAATVYGEIQFTPNAGLFVLNGNPITVGGNIANNSTNAQAIDLGLILDGTAVRTLSGGATKPLIIGGGVTNTATTFNTLSLAGTGILTNLLNSTDPNGTNTISMTTSNANWTLMDNASSTPIVVPWAFDILAGTFNFGAGASAPNLTSITARGTPQDNRVGNVTGAIGTLNISNGTFTTFARLNTATVLNSTGVVNVVGGIFNLGDQFQGANGSNLGESSTFNLLGGTVNVGAATNATAQFYVASRGNGTLNMLGGALNCGVLDVSRNAAGNTFGSVGVVNLNGGVLTCSRVGAATANSQAGQNGVSGAFNFNGGTLKAGASSGTFFQGNASAPAIPITTTVKSGGAIIDTSSNAISILEPMKHDSTLGAVLDGGLVKLGAGTLTLGAANTYTGPTLVSNGTLFVSGSVGLSAVTVATNGTLAGTGSCGSNVTVSVGGTIAAGGLSVIGTLTINSNLVLLGTNAMDLNATTTTNDVLKANNITYGGTLSVTNLAGRLRTGQIFKLFSSGTGTYGGSFATTQLPPLWPGLSWVTSGLITSGTISISGTSAPPQITSNNVTGNTVTISGSGGLAGATYYVLEATNVAQPLPTWTRIATNSFDGSGNFSFTGTPHVPVLPAAFYTIQAP